MTGFGRFVDAIGQPVARVGWGQQQLGDLVGEAITRCSLPVPEGEHYKTHDATDEAIWKVVHYLLQGNLNLVNRIVKRPCQDRLVSRRSTLRLVPLQHGGTDIQMAQHIAEPCGNMLLLFQLATQGQHGNIGSEGEGSRVAGELLVVLRGFTVMRHGREFAETQTEHQASHCIPYGEADV